MTGKHKTKAQLIEELDTLRQNEERYRILVEQAADGIFVADQNGNYVDVNTGGCQMLGYTREEILQLNMRDLVPAEDRQAEPLRFGELLAGKIVINRRRLRRKDGSLLPVEISAKMLPNGYLQGIVRDITQHKQAEEALKQRNRELTALYEIGHALAATLDLPHLFRVMYRNIGQQLFDVPHFTVALYNAQTQLITCGFAVVDGVETDPAQFPPMPLGEDPVSDAIRTRQPCIFDLQAMLPDLEAKGRAVQIGDEQRPKSALYAPLVSGDKVIGVIGVQDYRADAFSQTDLNLLATLGTQAAVALENAQLFAQVQDHLQKLTVLQQAGLAFAQLLALDEVGQKVIEVMSNLLGYRRGAIFIIDGLNQNLRLLAHDSMGLDETAFQAEQQRVQNLVQGGKGISAWVAQHGQSVRLGNVKDDPRYVEADPAIQSELCVPLQVSGHTIGALNVESEQPNAFTKQDELLLTALAGQVAVALENARLYEQIQQYAAKLEQRVAERTTELNQRLVEVETLNHALANLLSDLQTTNRQLEATTQQLAAANTELETFTYTVSHDLKAPLRGIDGYSRLLLEDYSDRLDDKGRTFLHTIRRAADQMRQLIDDLLDYSRLERSPLAFGPVDLLSLVETVVAGRAGEIEQKGIDLTLDISCQTVQADANGLLQALRNLVDNAIKFTGPVAEPRLEIGSRATEKGWQLWVRDNGIGFDMQYHDRIFEIFNRLHPTKNYSGTGVGLAIVRKVMQQMGGQVWAESNPGAGATFYLEGGSQQNKMMNDE